MMSLIPLLFAWLISQGHHGSFTMGIDTKPPLFTCCASPLCAFVRPPFSHSSSLSSGRVPFFIHTMSPREGGNGLRRSSLQRKERACLVCVCSCFWASICHGKGLSTVWSLERRYGLIHSPLGTSHDMASVENGKSKGVDRRKAS